MDNTYNPHPDVTGSFGHGKTGWYSKDHSHPDSPEQLVSGSNETFTTNRCEMTLKIDDDKSASAYEEMYSSTVKKFSLSDIDPDSIKINTYSHLGGLRCEDYTPESRESQNMDCDHAEIHFSTQLEAPLIDDDTLIVFPKLTGDSHESRSHDKATGAYFEVNDVEYATHFAKALEHAVRLCGGKANGF